MYCTNCGQELPEDSVFCVKCGARVTSSVAEPEHEAIRATRDTASNTTPSISQQNDSTTKFNKDLIGKIIFFLIVVGGLFAYMYYAPIKAGDYFARIKFFRGEPIKEEKNLVVFQKEPLLVVDLYEYPDVVIVTEPADDRKGFNRVYGFVPVGKYEIVDLTDMYKNILKVYGINEKDDKLRMVMFPQPVQQNKEIPLQIKSGGIKTELKSNTTKKDDPETQKQPEVAQNPTNSNILQNENFTHTVGQTITIKGTGVNMRESYSRSSNVIGVFENGEKVEYLGEHFVRQDGIWMNVKRKNGMTGWVFGNYVKEMFADSNGQSTNNTTQAKDIFIDHWNYENVDIYVVDKSITSGTSGTDKFFKVTVKQVQNGKLIKSNVWSFSQFRGEWRYKTDEMKGNTSTVFNNKIFEYCMKQLGWPFEIVNGGYYK